MAAILVFILNIYSFIVLARVLLSYFPTVDPHNPIVRFLYDVTEPVLQPIREFLRQQFPNTGPFDFSPIALFIIIIILTRVIVIIF